MDIRSARTNGFFKHGLQQFDDGCFLGTRRRSEQAAKFDREQAAKFDRHIFQVGGQFPGQAADFFGAPIDAIDQRQQMTLGNYHQVDFATQQTQDFVIRLQVGGINESNPQSATHLVEHHRAKTPRLRLGQQIDQFRAGIEVSEIDVGNAQLFCKRLRNRLFGDK